MTEPTIDQCKDAAIMAGLTEADGEEFFYHYAAQGWVFGNGQPVKNISFALCKWKIRSKKKEGKKEKLYHIRGKFCCKRGCNMPAVYKSIAGYEDHYCLTHAPAKIREKYC